MKKKLYLQNKKRILKKIVGTKEKPRLSIFKSNKHIYAQIINDFTGHTLVASNSLMLENNQKSLKKKCIVELVGKNLSLKGQTKGIQKVIFDCGQHIYHGHIKFLAEKAREYGLLF